MDESLNAKVKELVAALQLAVNATHAASGYTFPAETVGSSGCFLVEKETGELFNIKGYGVPDRNKKKKADLGNIFTAELATLFARRHNYLR